MTKVCSLQKLLALKKKKIEIESKTHVQAILKSEIIVACYMYRIYRENIQLFKGNEKNK